MRKIIAVFLLVLFSQAFAVSPDARLDPDLKAIFNQLVLPAESKKLIGKKFSVVLSLKLATKRHLIFHDAYIKVSKDEKYQIAKWLFDPAVVSRVEGKNGIDCSVEFIVKEVRTEGVYRKMPHIVVEVVKINI